jgi:hypothetical protein
MEELVFLMYGIKVYRNSRFRVSVMILWLSFAIALPQYILYKFMDFHEIDMDIQQVHWRLPHLHTFNLVSLIIISWQKLNLRAGSNTNAMEDLCCKRS